VKTEGHRLSNGGTRAHNRLLTSPGSTVRGSRASWDTVGDQIVETAQRVFGYKSLRPGQYEAVRALLDGHDVLLIQPTGAGKSLAYQLPAVLINGPTLVVSPLLALQEDQTTRLEEYGHRTVARRVSSAETKTEREEALADAAAGKVEFLFLAPEQLANEEVLAAVTAMRPSLIAIDEAHCVSSWGHDFRPDYLRLGELLDGLRSARIIALTATAAPPVREDIIERLQLKSPVVVVGGAARENIYLAVFRCLDERDQQAKVIDTVANTAGPGIVYVATRRAAEGYAQELQTRGIGAAAYHAGLPKRSREEVQQNFMITESDVMIATSAFGMGIDKPDIRFVLHAQAPESPDEYYQQVGRAGRDGQSALGMLFYRPEDLGLARFFNSSIPKEDDIAAVLGALATRAHASRADLARVTDLSTRKIGRILNLLSETGLEPDTSAVEQVIARAEAYRAMQKSRIEMMRAYAETMRCRRQFLLQYFGEVDPRPCGDCDNCHAGTASDEPELVSPFVVEQRVQHDSFGPGMVMSLDGEEITVLFDDVGYRTLFLPTVLERRLLEPAKDQ
jgi:ATP-dependent DNA helicase RecQ